MMNTLRSIIALGALLLVVAFSTYEAHAYKIVLPGEFVAAEINPCCTVWCLSAQDEVCAIIETAAKSAKVNSPDPMYIRYQGWQSEKGTYNGQKATEVHFIGGELIE